MEDMEQPSSAILVVLNKLDLIIDTRDLLHATWCRRNRMAEIYSYRMDPCDETLRTDWMIIPIYRCLT